MQLILCRNVIEFLSKFHQEIAFCITTEMLKSVHIHVKMIVQVTLILHVFLEIILQSSGNHYEYMYKYCHVSFSHFRIMCWSVFKFTALFHLCILSLSSFSCFVPRFSFVVKLGIFTRHRTFIHAMNHYSSVSCLSINRVGACERVYCALYFSRLN